MVLVGTRFWQGLVDWMEDELAGRGMIAPADLDLFTVTDEPAEVVRLVQQGELRQGWPRGPALLAAGG